MLNNMSLSTPRLESAVNPYGYSPPRDVSAGRPVGSEGLHGVSPLFRRGPARAGADGAQRRAADRAAVHRPAGAGRRRPPPRRDPRCRRCRRTIACDRQCRRGRIRRDGCRRGRPQQTKSACRDGMEDSRTDPRCPSILLATTAVTPLKTPQGAKSGAEFRLPPRG